MFRDRLSTMSTSDKFRDSFLKKTNEYRKRHRAKPLTLSSDLCEGCQTWANILATQKQLKHSSAGKTRKTDTGENLYYIGTTDDLFQLKGSAAVKAWYNEIKHYKFKDSEDQIMQKFNKVGHFTQLVWKETKNVGVAMAENNGIFVVVAQYEPAGNLVGSFKMNVKDKKEKSSSSVSEFQGSSSSDENENISSSAAAGRDIGNHDDHIRRWV